MHGFLNVFVAAALARELVLHGYPDPEAQATIAAVLDEPDPHAFAWDDDGVTWREHRVDVAELTAMRQQAARSFGSCSFEEPIADLRQLRDCVWILRTVGRPHVRLNETHNPDTLSWVASANAPDADFPAAESAVRRVRRTVTTTTPRIGVAIGDRILDVAACHARGLFDGRAAAGADACTGDDAERADGARAAGLVGAARAAQRAAARVSSRSAAPARAGRAVPRADGGRDDAAAGRDRRLHRLLRVDPSRHATSDR